MDDSAGSDLTTGTFRKDTWFSGAHGATVTMKNRQHHPEMGLPSYETSGDRLSHDFKSHGPFVHGPHMLRARRPWNWRARPACRLTLPSPQSMAGHRQRWRLGGLMTGEEM